MVARIVDDEEFAAIWNAATSAEEAAEKSGVMVSTAKKKSSFLRRVRGMNLKSYQRAPKFPMRCENCGSEFLVIPARAKAGRRFCSKKCFLDSGATAHATHGMSNSRLYVIWRGMRTRCHSPGHPVFKHYGGRGIVVCQEWRDSFESFYSWAMSAGYCDDLTIDRIDTLGNYEPSNCRWATRSQQMKNTRPHSRRNKKSRFKGVSSYFTGDGIRWNARVNCKHIGSFASEEEAARAYDAAAREQYGEFAHLNFA